MELYVIIDEGLLGGTDIRRVTADVVRGGADAIQFRAKHHSKARYLQDALSILNLVHQDGVPFIVNDHLDVAIALAADGIHRGQEDLPCSAARQVAPQHMLLGISTHSVEQAEKAVADGADYIAIGPIFPTTTKENPEDVVGLEMIRAVKDRVGEVPLVAIGGINAGNVGEVIRSGADGVAVASAVILADDPYLATTELKEKIRNERVT